jgi:hypothetical protein
MISNLLIIHDKILNLPSYQKLIIFIDLVLLNLLSKPFVTPSDKIRKEQKKLATTCHDKEKSNNIL